MDDTGSETRPIAVGVDASAESRAAVAWAANEAVYRALPLHLVHAWIDEPLYAPPTPEREAAARLLDSAEAEAAGRFPGLAVTTELLPATAASGLTEQADRSTMLVLGSRGHSAIVGFLLGSVGLPVIAHASNPVVLVRPRPGEGQAVEEGDEVVVGLKDFDPAAARVLDFAFTSAAARSAAVRVVRAWGAPSLFGADVPHELESGAHRDLEEQEGRALAELLDPWRQRFPGVPVVEHLRFGNASEVLLTAASFRAALVVVGRRRRRPRLGLRVGPVVHAALHHATPPVAVVPYD
ncbi:universal stress protein [Streptomyces sp. 4N509B]|uniref:universal stress protein n=1 Tax=Streptomyces sp. 4N509B TaxID=3457413 RepID=UPI003FD029B4